MSYQEALRVAIANELCKRLDEELPIHPNDITDISVRWDNGDRYDPTYGDTGNEAPTFEVEVTLNSQFHHNARRTVSVELVFSALLKAVLETGL